MKYVFRDEIEFHVRYDDQTIFGSPMSTKTQEVLGEIFLSVSNYIAECREINWRTLTELCRSSLLKAEESGMLNLQQDGSWTLSREFLFPPLEGCRPHQLLVVDRASNAQAQFKIPMDMWPSIHELLARLSGAGVSAGDACNQNCQHADLEAFFDVLENAKFVVPAELAATGCSREELDAGDIVFLGHNTVFVQSSCGGILVDPLLFPRSPDNPPNYQPIQTRELSRVEFVLITHGHPDHFDPGSLLQISPNAVVVVPHCERETVLAPCLAARLFELGFTKVHQLKWGETLNFGDVVITSMPFLGEDPCASFRLHPEVRNAGNTYLIEAAQSRFLFLADAGADDRGSVVAALQQYLNGRRPDVVFSGYRGWEAYPFQHLLSSVSAYFLFCDPRNWSVRQQTMLDARQSIDVTESLGGQILVPYADGGAPWHWRMELGPVLEEANRPIERIGFDYRPEQVREAAAQRTSLGPDRFVSSPVDVVVWRPNAIGRIVRSPHGLPSLATREWEGNAWPY